MVLPDDLSNANNRRRTEISGAQIAGQLFFLLSMGFAFSSKRTTLRRHSTLAMLSRLKSLRLTLPGAPVAESSIVRIASRPIAQNLN